jgi:hypothetical protein
MPLGRDHKKLDVITLACKPHKPPLGEQLRLALGLSVLEFSFAVLRRYGYIFLMDCGYQATRHGGENGSRSSPSDFRR